MIINKSGEKTYRIWYQCLQELQVVLLVSDMKLYPDVPNKMAHDI